MLSICLLPHFTCWFTNKTIPFIMIWWKDKRKRNYSLFTPFWENHLVFDFFFHEYQRVIHFHNQHISERSADAAFCPYGYQTTYHVQSDKFQIIFCRIANLQWIFCVLISISNRTVLFPNKFLLIFAWWILPEIKYVNSIAFGQ